MRPWRRAATHTALRRGKWPLAEALRDAGTTREDGLTSDGGEERKLHLDSAAALFLGPPHS